MHNNHKLDPVSTALVAYGVLVAVLAALGLVWNL
jgi:hypothetical protein